MHKREHSSCTCNDASGITGSHYAVLFFFCKAKVDITFREAEQERWLEHCLALPLLISLYLGSSFSGKSTLPWGAVAHSRYRSTLLAQPMKGAILLPLLYNSVLYTSSRILCFDIAKWGKAEGGKYLRMPVELWTFLNVFFFFCYNLELTWNTSKCYRSAQNWPKY